MLVTDLTELLTITLVSKRPPCLTLTHGSLDLNVNGTIVFGRCVQKLQVVLLSYSECIIRMVADLMEASYPGEIPYVANAALTYNINHGIASY